LKNLHRWGSADFGMERDWIWRSKFKSRDGTQEVSKTGSLISGKRSTEGVGGAVSVGG